MITAGLRMDDVWAHRVLRRRGVEAYSIERAPVELGVLVESVQLCHHGPEEKYRPYLHLNGELQAVQSPQELIYGIDTVTYPAGGGHQIDAFYEFDDAQLAELVGKRYFDRGFEVPHAIEGITWQLPAVADLLIVAPDVAKGEHAPIVFTKIHDAGRLELNLENSGYDLAAYFPTPQASQAGPTGPEVENEDIRALRARSDAMNLLFTEDEIEASVENERTLFSDLPGAGPDQHPTQSQTDVSAEQADQQSRLDAMRAEIAAERDALQRQRAEGDDSIDRLYDEHVARSLREDYWAPNGAAGEAGEPVAASSGEPEPSEAQEPLAYDDSWLVEPEDAPLTEEQHEQHEQQAGSAPSAPSPLSDPEAMLAFAAASTAAAVTPAVAAAPAAPDAGAVDSIEGDLDTGVAPILGQAEQERKRRQAPEHTEVLSRRTLQFDEPSDLSLDPEAEDGRSAQNDDDGYSL